MHVMHKGFVGDKPVTMQAWNTRIVTTLLNSAKGDLMLDSYGNLCTRMTYDPVTWGTLPFEQHTPSETLALIGRDGWLLTIAGAQWIIENCPPDSKLDLRRLRAVAGGWEG